MRQITPIEAALEWIDHLEAKKDRSDLEEWQLQAFKRFRSGSVETLEQGFGLNVGPGQAHKRFPAVWRKRERNQLIRQAAANLTADYGKVRTATLIAFAMNTAIPPLHTLKKWETTVILCKLRNICMNQVGDSNLALSCRRTLEIMNGDGC